MNKINEWLEEYRDNANYACDYFGYTHQEMIGFIIEKIDDFNKWKELYKEQTGTEPRRDFDVVAYFEELRKVANDVIGTFNAKASEQTIESMKREPKAFFKRWEIARG